ncbi:MAG: hypothetical protein K2X91_04170 [Thermoleophilia bacterium]|nr:hypothetical protein [Thermoleophilia bacterium]
MGEAKRRRFSSVEGPGAAKVAGLPEAEQEALHRICVMAAMAADAQMVLLAAQAVEIHPGHGTNAALSGALHGLARYAWRIRTPGLTRQEILRMMTMGIENALAQTEAAELMGGPVQGNG